MISFTNETKIKMDAKFFTGTVQKILDLIKHSEADVNIVIVSSEKSRELNGMYRGKDKPTNILSFPNNEVADFISPEGESKILGQLFICVDVVDSESRENSYPRDKWLTRLIVHGILHLSGYTHDTTETAESMENEEDRIVSLL